MDHPTNTPSDSEAGDIPSRSEELTDRVIKGLQGSLDNRGRESAFALFQGLHPVDQSEVLLALSPEQAHQLLSGLTVRQAADVLEQMDPEMVVEVARDIEDSALSRILDEMSADAAADVLRRLPEERSLEALRTMEEAEEVTPLLQYPDDTAGGLMTPDYPVFKDSTATGIALDQLRLLGPDAEGISSILVVDDSQKLLGSLSVTRLALARPTAVVGDLIDRAIISVSDNTDQEDCARLMERYNLSQLPVIDENGLLAGVILAEDLVDVVEEEATEDMYRMAGVAGERVFGPLRNSLVRRLPWLYLNLATAFLAAVVISLFEGTIKEVVALAVFLPVVAGQGGIGGTQTVTLVVRSMALGEVPPRRGLRLLPRELALGVINGVSLGLVVGLVAYLWKGTYMLGVVLGLAMLGNMLIAGLAGAGVPLLLRKLHMDPAVSSAVFVTTFTDVIGFLLFLGLAASLVDFL